MYSNILASPKTGRDNCMTVGLGIVPLTLS